MTGFLARLVATGIAFMAAAWLVPQIEFPATKLADPVHDILEIAVVALVFGFVNAIIKPIVKLLSLPVRLATLGLFSIVINAGLLILVAWAADKFNVVFTIGTFPPSLNLDTLVGAVLGSIVISVVGAITGIFVKD